MRIEEFAFRFHAPVVLVGPSSEYELHVNPPANLIIERISLQSNRWIPIEKPGQFQELAVL